MHQGVYSLTPESAAFLVSTKPSFQGGLILHTSKQLIPKWLDLREIVATGKPVSSVNQEATESEFFQQLVTDIFPMNYPPAQLLAQTLKFGDTGQPVSVLDLAAGRGSGASLSRKAPNVFASLRWTGPTFSPLPERRCNASI